MTHSEQQLDEMITAIQQVINVQDFKARKEVLNLIEHGVNNKDNPAQILSTVLDWCGNA